MPFNPNEVEIKDETNTAMDSNSDAIKIIPKGKPNKNPWDIRSIYELQYFNCPKCFYKDNSKQDFINHAFEMHPEAVGNLNKIVDGSLNDVTYPWNETNFINFKEELKPMVFYPSNNFTKKINKCFFCSKHFKSKKVYVKSLFPKVIFCTVLENGSKYRIQK